MPEIIVTRAFNYREGLDAAHYPASKAAPPSALPPP